MKKQLKQQYKETKMSKKMNKKEHDLVTTEYFKDLGDTLSAKGYPVEYWYHDEYAVATLVILMIAKENDASALLNKVIEGDIIGVNFFFATNELRDLYDEEGVEGLWSEGWKVPTDSYMIKDYKEHMMETVL